MRTNARWTRVLCAAAVLSATTSCGSGGGGNDQVAVGQLVYTAFVPNIVDSRVRTAFQILGQNFNTQAGSTVDIVFSTLDGAPIFAAGSLAEVTVPGLVLSDTVVSALSPLARLPEGGAVLVEVRVVLESGIDVVGPTQFFFQGPEIFPITSGGLTPPLRQTILTDFTISGLAFGNPGENVTVRFSCSSLPLNPTPYEEGEAPFATVHGIVVDSSTIQGTAPTVRATEDFVGCVQVLFEDGSGSNVQTGVPWIAAPFITSVSSTPAPVPTGAGSFVAACPTSMRIVGRNFVQDQAQAYVFDQAVGVSDPFGTGTLGTPVSILPTAIVGTSPADRLLEGTHALGVRVTNPDGQTGFFTSESSVYTTVAHHPDVDVTKTAGNDANSAVAIDPTNTQRAFALTGGDAGSAASRLTQAISLDGGRTWTSQTLVDGKSSAGATRAFPKAAFDRFGNLYVSYLYTSGTTTEVMCLQSADGGATFPTVRTVRSASSAFLGLGNGLAAGRDGSTATREAVYVTWVEALTAGPTDFVVSVNGANSTGLGNLSAFNGSATTVTDTPAIPGLSYHEPDAAVGPEGELYVVWTREETPNLGASPVTLLADVDLDGLFSGTRVFGTDVLVTTSNVQFREPVPATTRGATPSPRLAVVPTGTFKGRLMVVFVDEIFEDDAATDVDQLFVSAIFTDTRLGGTLGGFGPVRRVNDGDRGAQFQPAVGVDPVFGEVHVAWYDTRDDLANVKVARMTARTTDGGDTWDPSLVLSDGTSTAPAVDGFGEYQGLAVSGRCGVAIWDDSSGVPAGNPDGTAKTDGVVAVFQNGPR